jgi:putative zinc- or iron-chelating protein
MEATAPRQKRLELESQLQSLASQVCRDGLPVPHRPEATMALAVAIRDLLRDASQASRASKAGALVARVFDQTMGRLPAAYSGQALACSAGCSFCCYNVVMATAPEVFLAATELRASHDQAFVEAVGAKGDAPRQAGGGAKKSPCPLLHDNLCSVYSARPSVCRKHNSFSVSACIADYEGRGGEIPIRRFDQEIFECCAVALLVGMRLWDERQGAVFELSGALRIALQDPYAEQKWLAGEGVFAGVASQSKLPGIDEHAAFLWGRFVGSSGRLG